MTKLMTTPVVRLLERAGWRVSLAAACALSAGASQARAQQAPPSSPPPPPAIQPAAPPLLAPAKAPPPASGVRAIATQRTPTPAVVRPMKREGVPPDSVRPVARSAPAVQPLRAVPAPPKPLSADARIAAAALVVAPAGRTPTGATMQCKDGTYLTGAASAGRCANNGGVAATYPAPAPSVSPKPQPQRKQP